MVMPALGELIYGNEGTPFVEKDPLKLESICESALRTKKFIKVSIKEYKGKTEEGFLLGSIYKTYSL